MSGERSCWNCGTAREDGTCDYFEPDSCGEGRKFWMPKAAKTTVTTVENGDLWVMLMSTIRYGLPRRSGIAHEAKMLIDKYGRNLNDRQLQQMAEEIQSARQAAGGVLYDDAVWLQIAAWCKGMVGFRVGG